MICFNMLVGRCSSKTVRPRNGRELNAEWRAGSADWTVDDWNNLATISSLPLRDLLSESNLASSLSLSTHPDVLFDATSQLRGMLRKRGHTFGPTTQQDGNEVV